MSDAVEKKPRKKNNLPKFEYYAETVTHNTMEDKTILAALNALGNDGYELVNVVTTNVSSMYIFMREKK